jgi:hypothetical protein
MSKMTPGGKKSATPKPGTALASTVELLMPEKMTHEHHGDAELKEQQAAVDVMVAEVEKRLKLQQRTCRKDKKALADRVPVAEKAADKALQKFAEEYVVDIVDAIKDMATSVPLKSKKIETTITPRGTCKDDTALLIMVSVSGCKPHIRFDATLEGKIPADVRKICAAVKKLQKDIKDIDRRSLEIHRSLANLDTAERQARARYAREILARTDAGKKVLEGIDGELDTTLLLLE